MYSIYVEPANSKPTEELVTKRLSLSNGAETSVGNLLSVKLNTVLRESESLLHKRCQLSNPPSLLTYNTQTNTINIKSEAFDSKGRLEPTHTENILSTCGSDDNLSPHRSNPNLHT